MLHLWAGYLLCRKTDQTIERSAAACLGSPITWQLDTIKHSNSQYEYPLNIQYLSKNLLKKNLQLSTWPLRVGFLMMWLAGPHVDDKEICFPGLLQRHRQLTVIKSSLLFAVVEWLQSSPRPRLWSPFGESTEKQSTKHPAICLSVYVNLLFVTSCHRNALHCSNVGCGK